MKRRDFIVCGGVALAMVVAGWASGCGAPAEAKPLDVTYYYLPG